MTLIKPELLSVYVIMLKERVTTFLRLYLQNHNDFDGVILRIVRKEISHCAARKPLNYKNQVIDSYGQKFSRGLIFASHFFRISRGVNFANWLPVIIREDLFSQILVLSIFYGF